MTTTVRIFTFSGLMTAPVASGASRFSTDSVGLLKFPYISRETITANGSAQSTAADLTPDGVQLALIQIEPGKSVHFELNPGGRSVPADVDSPVISGDQIVKIGWGWTISLLEAAIA